MEFIQPDFSLRSFTCPHCNTITMQYRWAYGNVQNSNPIPETQSNFINHPIKLSICELCQRVTIWYEGKLIHPNRCNSPHPNPDMPDEVKQDYEEAATIISKSPRGAAALLRLAIQKLCINLGGKGVKIDDDIKLLVDKGLPPVIQQALDIVRVTGNNAVHPGQMDFNDQNIAGELFNLVNSIVEYMVSMPKKVDNMFNSLPDAAKKAIVNRDKK